MVFVDFQRVAPAPDQLYLQLLWLEGDYRIAASREHLHPETELVLVFDPPRPRSPNRSFVFSNASGSPSLSDSPGKGADRRRCFASR